MRPCSLVDVYLRFGGTYCLHLHDGNVSQISIQRWSDCSLLVPCSTLEMEAVRSSETWVKFTGLRGVVCIVPLWELKFKNVFLSFLGGVSETKYVYIQPPLEFTLRMCTWFQLAVFSIMTKWKCFLCILYWWLSVVAGQTAGIIARLARCLHVFSCR
jgi:hypothetical protein